MPSKPRPQPQRRDPAPSRTAYRLHRFWLTPQYRLLARFGVPLVLAFLAGAWYLGDDERRGALSAGVVNIRTSVEQRPEFMVKLMAVDGASPVVDQMIRDYFPIDFPISSFDLDLEVMQAEIAEFDMVEQVALRIRPGGVLEVALKERVPAAIWRSANALILLDADGHRIATIPHRTARPDLPLLAGGGAEDHVGEALELYRAAAPFAERLRGLVHVGDRRWDLVLTRDQRILLPEEDPVMALAQIIALDQAQDLLARDLTVIDMRNPLRPTLRMAQHAAEELRRIKAIELGDPLR
jgi:cell division protein FtsQ